MALRQAAHSAQKAGGRCNKRRVMRFYSGLQVSHQPVICFGVHALWPWGDVAVKILILGAQLPINSGLAFVGAVSPGLSLAAIGEPICLARGKGYGAWGKIEF